MDKKYELMETDYDGFYRIKALKDFQLITGEIVRKGDLGGCVHGAHNLSQEGICWIMDEAYVEGQVSENAVVKNCATVKTTGAVLGNAVVRDETYVDGQVCGNAEIKDCAFVGTDTITTGNAIVQAWQRIRYGTVTTDLLGTKDWAGALYAEFGIVPEDGKVILYKRIFKTKFKNVFKSVYNDDFHYLIGKKAIETDVDEDVMKYCGKGLHFTSLEFINLYVGNTILECEVDLKDIITIQHGIVRARKCRVIRTIEKE